MLQLFLDNLDAIGKGAGGAASVFLLWKKWVGPFIRRIIVALETIAKQLNPNGGGSMFDKVMRVSELFRVHLNLLEQEAVFETDAEGRVIFANPAYLDLVKRRIEEVVGHGWINTVYQPDRDEVIEEWRHAIDDRRSIDAAYHLTAPTGGNGMKVNALAMPMRDADGNVTGYLGRVRKAV